MHIHATADGLDRLRGRVTASVVLACLAPPSILLMSCLLYDRFAFPGGMKPVEYADLSYSQYASKVGIEALNPTEGRQISFKSVCQHRFVRLLVKVYSLRIAVPDVARCRDTGPPRSAKS